MYLSTKLRLVNKFCFVSLRQKLKARCVFASLRCYWFSFCVFFNSSNVERERDRANNHMWHTLDGEKLELRLTYCDANQMEITARVVLLVHQASGFTWFFAVRKLQASASTFGEKQSCNRRHTSFCKKKKIFYEKNYKTEWWQQPWRHRLRTVSFNCHQSPCDLQLIWIEVNWKNRHNNKCVPRSANDSSKHVLFVWLLVVDFNCLEMVSHHYGYKQYTKLPHCKLSKSLEASCRLFRLTWWCCF